SDEVDEENRRQLPLGRRRRRRCRRTLRLQPRSTRRSGRKVEARLVAQDRLLEILQDPGRLEPELVDERAPPVLVDRQRLGLSAGAIEREHERRTRPLAEWMLANERLEFPDQTSVPAKREFGLDPLLERLELQLLEA